MRRTPPAAILLFFSGACALIYQTAWLRQFRLIFGASTFATAAVLAIFMGGLGIGSAVLGRRADAHPRPLAMYGGLELLIATTAALSQPLLWLIAKIYVALGGSTVLGLGGASVVRLLLATVVLGIPTFLMGGTLPAASRAVETSEDAGRRNLAALYGVNTLGAVAGTLLSTFYMLESFGNQRTLLTAAVVNVLVGLTARAIARDAAPDRPDLEIRESVAPARFVLAAAAVTGFAFLLMELVWYRMLSPLLGGTTFMFGLILAIALLGIGLGGAAYALRGSEARATIGGFALTCTLEAAALIAPYALGDRLAIFTNLIRPLGRLGFGGHVMGWTLVTLVVVFPAAFISGIQFPLMINLLGRGREEVGRHVGIAYAFNTAGAIAGSLAGGFGLMPLLSARGCWVVVVFLLLGIGVIAIFLGTRERQFIRGGAASTAALLALAGTFALGPTAVWRHSAIGAGRAPIPASRLDLREWINSSRRDLQWDADGRESSIAVIDAEDLGFIVNGKADGSARGDAGTQVMSGILAATIHPNPRKAMVIGLGTGSTAGWLGAIPSMERVDVAELEPVVLRVARDFSSVNHDVLHNPKVHIQIADAREVLLTTPSRYDVIFSEPSNPFRAGIASLFTREFYQGVSGRLAPGGIFVQWVQAYDVDSRTVATIYATITSVFPHVETWRAEAGDLLLVATRQPLVYDADMIRARVLTRGFGAPLHNAWRAEGLEGFFSRYVGRDTLAKAIAATAESLNTDDRTPVEFGFGRGLGEETGFNTERLIELAQRREEFAPARVRGRLNWGLVLLHRASDPFVGSPSPLPLPDYSIHQRFAHAYDTTDFKTAQSIWDANHFQILNSRELLEVAHVNAVAGREEAAPMAEQLRGAHVAETEAVLAQLRFTQKRFTEAVVHTERAFLAYRTDPWPMSEVMGRLFDVALALARANPAAAMRLYAAVQKPFAAGQWDDARRFYAVVIGEAVRPCGAESLHALADLEPSPHWREDILKLRVTCYKKAGLADAAAVAREEYAEFVSMRPPPLVK